MSGPVRDPVHRVSCAFSPEGENVKVDAWMEAGGELPPHWHPSQEECWWVIEGRVRFRLGREKRVIGPEDGKMVVAPGTVHGLKAVDSATAHLGCYVTPAMNLQAFLEESAAAASDGLFMKGGIPKSLKGARWAADFLARYEDDVVMVFPPRFAQRAMMALLGTRGAKATSATMGGDAH